MTRACRSLRLLTFPVALIALEYACRIARPLPHTFAPSAFRRVLLGAAFGSAARGQEARAQFPFFGADIPAPPDVGAVPADAQVTPSGLAFKVLQLPACESEAECKAERPQKFDKVTVDYTGWQRDGRMFDSSVKRGQKATFGVGQVIKGRMMCQANASLLICSDTRQSLSYSHFQAFQQQGMAGPKAVDGGE